MFLFPGPTGSVVVLHIILQKETNTCRPQKPQSECRSDILQHRLTETRTHMFRYVLFLGECLLGRDQGPSFSHGTETGNQDRILVSTSPTIHFSQQNQLFWILKI
jgi:hypothetical protein